MPMTATSHSSSTVDPSLIRKVLANSQPSNNGRWIRVDCPYCRGIVGKNDRQASFGINRATGRGHCFRCKVWLYLSEFAGHEGSGIGDATPTPETTIQLPSGYKPLWTREGCSAPALAFAREYLAKRGISPSTIEDASIGACTTGRCVGRVVLPAFSIDGQHLVGWSARLTYPSDKWPKYLTAQGMDRSQYFWNMPAIAQVSDDPLMICEGVFDALPYWPNAIALLGKPSDGQVWYIAKAVAVTKRKVVVTLDGDAQLESDMLHLLLKLRIYEADLIRLQINDEQANAQGLNMLTYPVTWVKLPACTDPGNVPTKKLWELVQKSAAGGDNLSLAR